MSTVSTRESLPKGNGLANGSCGPFALVATAGGGEAFVLFVGRPKGNGLAKGKRCGSARRRV